jgi:hypothetical protein
MSDLYSIESNIPMPVRARARMSKYPFRKLQVGQSFLVPCTRWDKKKATNSLTSCRRNAEKKMPGKKFALRTERDGIRIWRTD